MFVLGMSLAGNPSPALLLNGSSATLHNLAHHACWWSQVIPFLQIPSIVDWEAKVNAAGGLHGGPDIHLQSRWVGATKLGSAWRIHKSSKPGHHQLSEGGHCPQLNCLMGVSQRECSANQCARAQPMVSSIWDSSRQQACLFVLEYDISS